MQYNKQDNTQKDSLNAKQSQLHNQ